MKSDICSGLERHETDLLDCVLIACIVPDERKFPVKRPLPSGYVLLVQCGKFPGCVALSMLDRLSISQ